MAITSANSGNSISHCGNNIYHQNYVTFHLSQLIPHVDLIHICDNNICHKGINGHIPHGNNICQTLVVNIKLTITSVIILIKVDLTSVNIISVD